MDRLSRHLSYKLLAECMNESCPSCWVRRECINSDQFKYSISFGYVIEAIQVRLPHDFFLIRMHIKVYLEFDLLASVVCILLGIEAMVVFTSLSKQPAMFILKALKAVFACSRVYKKA